MQVSAKSYRDLIVIFKSAFKIIVKESEISCKFDTPSGVIKDLGYIAYSEKNEPSGFYGVYPFKAVIDKEIVLVSQSGDTMVHKAHERKGLFTSLANKTYALCKEEGIKGVFGFPSASSYYGFVNKLGWTHKENFRKYLFIIFTIPFSEMSHKFKILSPLFHFWRYIVLKFYKKGDYFRGNILDDEQDGIYRDIDYWNYKVKNNSIKVIRMHGCDVIIKFEGNLGIGDINYKDSVSLKKVIKSLKYLCFILDVSILTPLYVVSFTIKPLTILSNILVKIKLIYLINSGIFVTLLFTNS